MLPTAKVSGFRKGKESLSAVPDSPTPGKHLLLHSCGSPVFRLLAHSQLIGARSFVQSRKSRVRRFMARRLRRSSRPHLRRDTGRTISLSHGECKLCTWHALPVSVYLLRQFELKNSLLIVSGGLLHRAMPEGEGDGCEYEVQWGLRVGAWKNVPPTAATVEDDGWGKKVWTMRVTEHVYPQAWYFVRVRATNQHGPGEWSPQSLKLCCEGGRSIAQAKQDSGKRIPVG